jgi:[CysO sulfur-carrier protein]-S-L-cysteine hydrolase
MVISEQLRDQLIAHALRDAPHECCGLIAVAEGERMRAVSVLEASNAAASELRFEIDGLQVLRLLEQIEDEGLQMGAIYHSHTRSAPYPSQTDINFAAGWPGVEWVIVGVADRESPELHSYLIEGAEVSEVPIDASEVSI